VTIKNKYDCVLTQLCPLAKLVPLYTSEHNRTGLAIGKRIEEEPLIIDIYKFFLLQKVTLVNNIGVIYERMRTYMVVGVYASLLLFAQQCNGPELILKVNETVLFNSIPSHRISSTNNKTTQLFVLQ